MSRFSKWLQLFGLLLFCFSADAKPPLHAALKIEGARFRPLQIAVPDIKVSAPTSAALTQFAGQVTSTVRRDLELSGVFTVLDPRSYISDKKMEDWVNIGAEGVIKASVETGGTGAAAHAQMSQVGLMKSGKSTTYKATLAEPVLLGHQIANDAYLFFTGDPGIFSTHIVAIKEVSRVKQVVMMDADGQNERQLTQGEGPYLLPILTPEGNSVLYTSYLNNNPSLFEMNLGSTKTQVISTRPGLNIGPSISPDRRKIALTLSKDGNSEIYLIDRQGQNLQRLTNSWGIDTSPSFSPDGKQIAFVSSRSGNPHIYTMNIDGTNQKRMTFQGKYNQTPRWSPRGDLIVFCGRDENNVFDIFTLEVKSGTLARLTQNQGSNEEPSFAPNGRLIVFSSTRSGARDLFISNLDGSFQKQITSGGKYWTPNWGGLNGR